MNISTFSVCCLISICLIIPAVSSTTTDCCLSLSDVRLRDRNVKDYHIQLKGGLCPIDAVVLLTVKNKRVCANPDVQWVQNIMTKVNKKKEEATSGASLKPSITQSPPRRPKGKGRGKGQGRRRGKGKGRRGGSRVRKQQA